MGANKLLLDLGGAPVVRRTVEAVLAAELPVLAMLGHESETVTAALEGLPIMQAHAASFADGMGATLADGVGKPLLDQQWAGAVDTVGGEILFNVVMSLRYGASVACCGLTAGMGFKGNVAPFILRGVNLLGVDSVELPLVVKASMWDKLSLQWKLTNLESLAEEVGLEQLPQAIEQILAGKLVGRVLVRLD